MSIASRWMGDHIKSSKVSSWMGDHINKSISLNTETKMIEQYLDNLPIGPVWYYV